MLQSAEAYDREQRILSARVLASIRSSWSQVLLSDIDRTWALVAARVTAAVTGAQLTAAAAADTYVVAALTEAGTDASGEGRPITTSLAGIASDGRDLGDLLAEAPISAKTWIGQGVAPAAALTSAGSLLEMYALTQVADAGRVAVSVSTTARPRAGGYVRMLNPPSCSRCAVLAGKWFRWNQGFRRHPRCDCRHVPVSEDTAGDLTTDPLAYFRSLSGADQDRLFTQAGAQAIRDGADLGQVVNARRGLSSLAPAGSRITAAEARALGRRSGQVARVDVYGRPLLVTTEGTTIHGLAGQRLARAGAKTPRLMPEAIYEIAEDREDAIRLLRRFGYLL